MAHDESPVDAAAHPAASPEDEASRGSTAGEAPAAPRRRAASPRTRKTASEPVEPARPSDEPPPSPDAGTALKTVRSSRGRKSQAALPAATAPPALPPAGEVAGIETPPAAPEPAPVKPPRRRAPRRKPGAEEAAPPEAPESAVAEPAAPPLQPEGEVPAPHSRRGRRPQSRKADLAAEAAPATPEPPEAAPPPEVAPEPSPAQAEAVPARSRRRRGRRRAEPALPEVTGVEAQVQEEPEQPLPAFEEAPAPVRRGRTRRTAESAEDMSRGARVVRRKGLPELHIHGRPVAPMLFFGSFEGPKEAARVASEVRRAAAAGVHIHSTLVEIVCPLPLDDQVYESLDSRITQILDADPQGWVVPRLVFVPAPGWMRQYPNEVAHYAEGQSADPSIASDRFWMEAEHALAAAIEHVRRTPYGERVIGFHLERGEWFHAAESGYDRSFANREAFREWLRQKYKNSSVALRAAWHDGEVQFHTAEIPPMPTPRAELAFFEPRRGRRWIDFLEYTSDIAARRIVALSRVVKQASENQALVSVCYGYTFEFGHTFSGHLALSKLLAAPTIDIVSGPPSYRDRLPGQAGSLPGPVDSMAVHGKLWITEDDTRTHLAPARTEDDDFNPRLRSREATEQVHRRAMGKALAHQTGIAWMDLWGEGWLDAEDVWKRAGELRARMEDSLKVRRQRGPDVAVLVDERSLLHIQRGEAYLRRLLEGQRDLFQRCGASVGFYLQSDVTSKTFPTDAKLVVFLTPYRLATDQRTAVKEKLQSGGRTLVWMYAVGVCDERGHPAEGAHDVVGMALRQQSWNSEVGSRIVESRHPVTARLGGREVGVRERINPSFFVDDDEPGLHVLAEYVQSGLPSIAARDFGAWRSVFCGEPTLSLELLRGLCRWAGVHLYAAAGEDYLWAGHGWVTAHAARDGSKGIAIPEGQQLYDLEEGALTEEGAREHRVFLRAGTTRTFFVGSPEEMRKLGFAAGRRARGRAAAPGAAPEPKETEDEEEAPLALVAGAIGVDEAEPLSTLTEVPSPGMNGSEEAEGSRRRRRRRGGRGRRRRGRAGEGTSAEGVAGPAEPGEGGL